MLFTYNSNNFDGYSHQVQTDEFPEFQTDFFCNDRSTEDSGFLSNSNHSHEVSEIQDLEPEYMHENKQEYLMPQISHQMTQVPNLIPTWHPTYGNILMQFIPQMQPMTTTYYSQYAPHMPLIHPQLMMPQVHASPQNHFTQQKLFGHMRPVRNFSKKYPRRNQRGFNVLPCSKKNESWPVENLDDLVIDLRELNIGPSS